jgi:glycosyltransferase involved in cell wall biosynthesis
LVLSVVIPSYNSAEWLPETLNALKASITRSSWKAEVIIVDDGSTDGTSKVLKEFDSESAFDFRVIEQSNSGRFLSRWSGISTAKFDQILLLDSRVVVGLDSLNYLRNSLENGGRDFVWNAFVETDEKASLPGFFWDIPTRLFWGKFLANPRPISFGLKEFDSFPKGTGCIFLEKKLLMDSYLKVWPEGDLSLVSDDTRLLREIVQHQDILLDPKFHAVYKPRVDFASFFSHTYTRGTLFVDSYGGTSLARRLIILLGAVLPLGAIALIVTGLSWLVLSGLLIAVFVPMVIGAFRRASGKALASYLLLVIPFGLLFWAGLVRGIWVHRRHFAVDRRKGSK